MPYGYPCWGDSHVPTAASTRASAPWASYVITCGVVCVLATSITPGERGDHSLRGRDGVEGWQRAAGHRLPHAALDQCGSQDALHKSWIIFHVCGGDALSTGYDALQHERVEIGPNRLQDGGEAHRARTADTHRAMVGLRVIALITDSTM